MHPCDPDHLSSNRLIAALPAVVHARLAPHVQSVMFKAGDVVLDDDEPIDAVYFPTTVTGLAASPGDYPWQDHARGLVAHLVYGIVTDTVLRLLDD